MAENKNERWDGYSKSPLKDPIFGDDGFVGVKIQADTTKVFPKAPTQNQYVHDDLITMNPRIAFLDAIGQDIYDENFYIAESLDKNEDRHGMVLIKVKDAIIKAISDINGYTVKDQSMYIEPADELTFYSGDTEDDVYMIKIKKVR